MDPEDHSDLVSYTARRITIVSLTDTDTYR
jgi:hypothetical protein